MSVISYLRLSYSFKISMVALRHCQMRQIIIAFQNPLKTELVSDIVQLKVRRFKNGQHPPQDVHLQRRQPGATDELTAKTKPVDSTL